MLSRRFFCTFAILISLPLIILVIAPRFFHPKHVQISLHDELDDITLFRRATLSSLHPQANNQQSLRPKIAFMFLTNSDMTFAPLWQNFFNGHENFYNIYIHCDPTIKIKPVGGVFQNRFIPGKKTERGSPTLISAERRLLATAIIDDPLNLYFALISQHCIPLHSFDYVYNAIFHPPSSFFFSFPFYKHLPQSFIEIKSQEDIMMERYNARGHNVMEPEVPFNMFQMGSQFFILTRKHALVVIKERRLWRKFRLPCLNFDSCYPEEHYFPTLLSMEDPNGCTRYTLTRVNWTDSVDGHPHTYGPSEISIDLIHTLRKSNSTYSFLFARKFSPECLRKLLDIADSVILRD
uniref:Uncharacterized protein n=1 Tax=Kalanchoe fedtschenkoi TaxID=63787 RepID=A0A7N0T2Y7_KALFE